MSTARTPARGNTAVFEIAPELECNIPALSGFVGYRLNTPANFNLEREEEDDGSLNPSGFQEPMMPSTIRGSSPEFSLRLTTGDMLPFLYHFFRKVTKTPLAGGGGWEYLFEGLASGPDYGFTVKVGLPPVEAYLRHTFKISDLEMDLGTTSALLVKMTGMFIHGQSYDLAVADGGNVGTYVFAPSIRGPVKFHDLGNIYVQVSSISPDYRFRAEITDGVPVFPGAEVSMNLDGITGRGDWQNLQGSVKLKGIFDVVGTTVTATVAGIAKLQKYLEPGMAIQVGAESKIVASITSNDEFELTVAHTGGVGLTVHMLGRDFGFLGENKDPVEIVWQGSLIEWGDLAVGDEWVFTQPVATGTPVYTEFDRFNKANVEHFFREEGEPVWNKFGNIASTIKVSWPLEEEAGLGSRYITGIDRTGLLMGMLDPFDSVHRKRNVEFIKWAEAHSRIEAKIEILGKQLGDGTAREGFIITFPSSSVLGVDRPISGPNRLNISSRVMGTTNAAQVSPCIWRVISSFDWSPPVIIA